MKLDNIDLQVVIVATRGFLGISCCWYSRLWGVPPRRVLSPGAMAPGAQCLLIIILCAGRCYLSGKEPVPFSRFPKCL